MDGFVDLSSWTSWYYLEKMDREIRVCVECRSEYFVDSSRMAELCPECACHLYGYENCDHKFENGRCINCYWNGNSSDYIKNNNH
ncbi:MAG: hypothetical protein KTR26_16715 [Flammeovirgaceae bacterium]|nr:hypothetical protein [Flammeovirgaceae bacterium]